ncbi:hypothetical protein RRG08_046996 [Elysia crispata]|uniref:Uncharacterized protein n=1 Tax=Elysia crispata TaxID=231223 RepID=A0AAE1A8G9_9GAST|nr:hypothetical protein RRG08_046996 [Elysia crispata]
MIDKDLRLTDTRPDVEAEGEWKERKRGRSSSAGRAANILKLEGTLVSEDHPLAHALPVLITWVMLHDQPTGADHMSHASRPAYRR